MTVANEQVMDRSTDPPALLQYLKNISAAAQLCPACGGGGSYGAIIHGMPSTHICMHMENDHMVLNTLQAG